MNILDQLAAHARERVSAARAERPLETVRREALALERGDFPFERALGGDGLAFICECKKASPSKGLIAPEDFGFERCQKSDLLGGTPAENAAITRAILAGEKGHKRNAVLMNAGAGLYLYGKADSYAEGVALAAELIDSGKAAATLEKVVEVSNRPEEEA